MSKQMDLTGLVSEKKRNYSHDNVKQVETRSLAVELEGEPPDRTLRESIRLHGILDPIKVIPSMYPAHGGGLPYVVIDGRRRTLIAQELELPKVPVIIDTRNDINPDVLALAANYTRSPNPADAYWRLTRLLRRDGPIQHTPGSVSAVTGMSVGQIKSILETGDQLDSRLMLAVQTGAITWDTAKTVADFPPAAQERVVALYEEQGKVTKKEATALRRQRASEERATMPARLFTAGDAAPDRDGAGTRHEELFMARSHVHQAIAFIASAGYEDTSLALDLADVATRIEGLLQTYDANAEPETSPEPAEAELAVSA